MKNIQTLGQNDVEFAVIMADRTRLNVTFSDDVVIAPNGPRTIKSAEAKLIEAIEGGKVLKRTNMASALRYEVVSKGSTRTFEEKKSLLGRSSWTEVIDGPPVVDVLSITGGTDDSN